MNTRQVGLGDAFSEGWAAFLKYPGLALGGYVLYTVIYAGASVIPFLGWLVGIFVGFPLFGGLVILSLKIVRGTDPEIGDLFAGFKDYWKWMGTGWLFVAVCLLCLVPANLLVGAAFVVSSLSPAASHSVIPGVPAVASPG